MDVLLGQVTHYFTHLGVAVIALKGELNIGDTLLFLGHTTDLTQVVCSIEQEHRRLNSAQVGMTVAVKVDEAVRQGDNIYKIVDDTQNPENQALWRTMRQVLEVVYHTYQPVIADFLQRYGLSEHAVSILLAAITMEPSTISPERLQVRGPYTAEQTWMARLHAAAEKGFLSEPEPGEFRLNRQGRSRVQKLIAESRSAMQRADPLPPEQGERLVALLGRLVQACLFTSPPPDTWCIRLSYQIMPSEEMRLPFIEQALSCLQAYRDDAHLASWEPSGLSAPALEALTLIWRAEAHSLETLYDKLSGRGFEKHDYRANLAELRQRGLLEGKDNNLRLTQAGQEFREAVESDTNRYFYTPWSILEPHEKLELSCLLADLRDGLRQKIPMVS